MLCLAYIFILSMNTYSDMHKRREKVNLNPFNDRYNESTPIDWDQQQRFFPPGPPSTPSMPGYPGMPGMPGMPSGGQNAQPMGPPPQFVPTSTNWQQGPPRSMRSCLYRNTYVWLNNRDDFWYFPTFVSRNMILGFRWRHRFGWVFQPLNPNSIRSFQCF